MAKKTKFSIHKISGEFNGTDVSFTLNITLKSTKRTGKILAVNSDDFDGWKR